METKFFSPDFYPTPLAVIEQMLQDENVQGKTVLEPSAGKGNIVDFLLSQGANVSACELNPDLRQIIAGKCSVLGEDFLKVESHQVSHIDFIIMNPPFSEDSKHIEHAFNIAPAGCRIVALCNLQSLKNTYSEQRKRLLSIIENNGFYENIGQCFAESERKTGVEVALVKMTKPGASNNSEFEGFFMDEEPADAGTAGLMPYNAIRDLVQRYTGAVQIYDLQLDAAVKMNTMTSGFFSAKMGMSVTHEQKPISRAEFKKAMQKSGWEFIFNKLNMQKYATKGLKDDLNSFIEKQTQIPFTMRNIYKMLEIIVGTQGSRMDKAILEVFDKVTSHHHDNRLNLEGWKTNSHYLLTKRFIMPCLTEIGYRGQVASRYSSNFEMVEDLIKALCYITGDNYSDLVSLMDALDYEYFLTKGGKFINNTYYDFDVKVKERDLSKIQNQLNDYPGAEIQQISKEWGKWFNWGYFKVRAYKKGTMHFEFLNEDIWNRFNQRVAKLKGYPLYEHNKQQAEKTEKKKENYKPASPKMEPVILGTFKLKTAV